jgi:hypothetical protein
VDRLQVVVREGVERRFQRQPDGESAEPEVEVPEPVVQPVPSEGRVTEDERAEPRIDREVEGPGDWR